ncbi:MAG: hypothetical protein A3F35_00965 [Candidatus Woykebacteria bacterium RIFCSPHIGHO2_12_FULL_45_10]|uniref:Uncharacterized protein n=1 Tax=Candidatus Woykebacteria bacterium RIFCSPHIGHO2_12_FULL_45_10 TaxID=1802603 RepID=A0A1G1WRK9_9BACT|nr:MAG: hypothetical protein A3F35_00965 [Candidatus Woykebacteria bacterium RIFCSPHIGHO2_12_FULL_45_10]
MLTKTITSISEIYKSTTILHPSYWFSARSAVALGKLYLYWFLVGTLLLVGLLFLFQLLRAKDPFRKRFFTKRLWVCWLLALIAITLTLLRAFGVAFLSARILWPVFFLALVYFSYASLLEFYRKIPAQEEKRQNELTKKKYLRGFRRK